MNTFVLLLVIGASILLTGFYLNRLKSKNAVLYGFAPYLAVIGLIVIALCVDKDSLFLIIAASVTATTCGCVWLGNREFDNNSNSQIRKLEPYPLGRHDLPFQRSAFDSKELEKPTGYRITSSGTRLELVASNKVPKFSNNHKPPDLKSVD